MSEAVMRNTANKGEARGAVVAKAGPRRARISGGSTPRGGFPPGTGHAGRAHGGIVTALALGALVLAFVVTLGGRKAHADSGSEYWDYNPMGDYVIYADFYTTTGNKGYCADYERHGPKGVTYNEWHYTGEASSSLARADPHALAWLATKLYPVDPTLNGRSPDNPQKASQLAVWMLQGDCTYSGTTVTGSDAVENGATRNDVRVAEALAKEALGYAGKSGAWDRASKIWVSPDNDHQNMLEVIPMGAIELRKASSAPGVTDGNDCYGLAGASYTIYADSACTKAVATIETDASGKATSDPIPAGTYWVRETGASKGYQLDTQAHKVVVAPGATATVTSEEVPLRYRIPLLLTKVDADGSPQAQGASSLAGARLEVSLYKGSHGASSLPSSPWRRWTVVTGADGTAELSASVVRDSSLVEGGVVSLPLGTLVVREVAPPQGYEPLSAPLVAHIEAGSNKAVLVGLAGWAPVGSVRNEVIRGGISVRKADAQTDAQAQGDATLAGAEFSIVNEGPGPVVVNGKSHPAGAEVMRIASDESGVATTGNGVLPYGNYLVTEQKPPRGYLLGEAWEAHVEVRGNEVVSLVEEPCEDDVMRGGLRLGKVSRETMSHVAQGGATLAGATFEVTLASSQDVVVGEDRYAKGEVVMTLVTNEQGVAETPERALPYGSYVVREVAPPMGYEQNDAWEQVVEVREDGVTYDLSSPEDSVPDQVMRGGLCFNKVAVGSMAAVGRCAFLVTSDATGEAHVVVTDENGEFDSERIGHAVRTNANDAALVTGEDGPRTVDDEALDPDAGMWFTGGPDLDVEPWDDFALPYDTYTVQELRCAANEGLDLVTFKVFVKRDGLAIHRGTVSDEGMPTVGTKLMHEGSREAPADTVTLTDIVTCSGLVVGGEYVVTGTLHDATTGAQIGEPSSVTIRAARKEETVEVPLEANLTQLGGTKVVAFEELSMDGVVVAQHADLDSEDQTLPVVPKPEEPTTPKEPTPGKPEEPEEPPAETPGKPVPTGVTPRTGDPFVRGAVPAGIACAGGAALGARRLFGRQGRARQQRRIY